jgi:hypothetical protein
MGQDNVDDTHRRHPQLSRHAGQNGGPRRGRVSGPGSPDPSIVLAGDQVEPSAEGFDVAGDGLYGGDFAALYLGYPAGDDTWPG